MKKIICIGVCLLLALFCWQIAGKIGSSKDNATFPPERLETLKEIRFAYIDYKSETQMHPASIETLIPYLSRDIEIKQKDYLLLSERNSDEASHYPVIIDLIEGAGTKRGTYVVYSSGVIAWHGQSSVAKIIESDSEKGQREAEGVEGVGSGGMARD